MGTGPFAVPTFRALLGSRHQVAALVTQPPRDAPGRRDAPANVIRAVAQEHGTLVLEPANVNNPEAGRQLGGLSPDLFVVADYGQILSAGTLSAAKMGGINLHGSLLPKYRGAAPINWAIFDGAAETGVSVIHMTPRVDAGPLVAQLRTPIDPDEDAVELEARLAVLGAPLVVQVVDDLARGTLQSLPQDASAATPARRLRKNDGVVDWSRSARQIRNQIRALEPWPKCHTYWHRPAGEPLRLILGPASEYPLDHKSDAGTVVVAAGETLVVATGEGGLRLHQVQPAGKRMLSAAEFLRGYPMQMGDRMSSNE